MFNSVLNDKPVDQMSPTFDGIDKSDRKWKNYRFSYYLRVSTALYERRTRATHTHVAIAVLLCAVLCSLLYSSNSSLPTAIPVVRCESPRECPRLQGCRLPMIRCTLARTHVSCIHRRSLLALRSPRWHWLSLIELITILQQANNVGIHHTGTLTMTFLMRNW